MDFQPSDEQALLRDTVARFLGDDTPAHEAGRGPITPAGWRGLADLGVFALAMPERAGGLDGRAQDAMLVGEALGRALAITPFAETVVGAAALIARYGDEVLVERWVAPTMSGDAKLALAVGGVREYGGTLHGTCRFARWAPSADAVVVLGDEAAFVVRTDSAGVTCAPARLADGTPAATLTLAGCAADRIPLPPGAAGQVLAEVQLVLVAELVGAMTLTHELALAYARERRQFGSPIGSFQVIQHKLARMFVAIEQSRSLLLKAGAADRDDGGFVRGVTAAKAYVAEAAQRVAEESVQIHGGIGVTDELVVGRALRRVIVLARLFGGAADARLKLAA
jgi:alkylation response protein AidB-like acyl-CoA dehydrogenase